jgi:hypothetical protein
MVGAASGEMSSVPGWWKRSEMGPIGPDAACVDTTGPDPAGLDSVGLSSLGLGFVGLGSLRLGVVGLGSTMRSSDSICPSACFPCASSAASCTVCWW